MNDIWSMQLEKGDESSNEEFTGGNVLKKVKLNSGVTFLACFDSDVCSLVWFGG